MGVRGFIMNSTNYERLAKNSLMKLRDFYDVKVKVYKELVKRSEYFTDWIVSPEQMQAEIQELEVRICESENELVHDHTSDDAEAMCTRDYRKFYVQLEQIYAQQGRNLVDIALQIHDIDLYKKSDQTDSYIAKLDLLDKIFDLYSSQSMNSDEITYCRESSCLGVCVGTCIDNCDSACSHNCFSDCTHSCTTNCNTYCNVDCSGTCSGQLTGQQGHA